MYSCVFLLHDICREVRITLIYSMALQPRKALGHPLTTWVCLSGKFSYTYFPPETTSLVQWLACLTTDHEVTGSIPGISTNFKCGLGQGRGPPSLVSTIGQLLDGEVADLIEKVDIIRLDGA